MTSFPSPAPSGSGARHAPRPTCRIEAASSVCTLPDASYERATGELVAVPTARTEPGRPPGVSIWTSRTACRTPRPSRHSASSYPGLAPSSTGLPSLMCPSQCPLPRQRRPDHRHQRGASAAEAPEERRQSGAAGARKLSKPKRSAGGRKTTSRRINPGPAGGRRAFALSFCTTFAEARSTFGPLSP